MHLDDPLPVHKQVRAYVEYKNDPPRQSKGVWQIVKTICKYLDHLFSYLSRKKSWSMIDFWLYCRTLQMIEWIRKKVTMRLREKGFALWARTTKNTHWSTGPLAPPFAHLLVPLTCSLALHCLLCSRAQLCSLVCSLTLLFPSLVGKWIIRWLFFLFWTIVHE